MCGGGLFFYLADLLANPWDGPINRFIFSHADISFFPLIVLAVYAVYPVYKYGSNILKTATVTLLFSTILLFALKSSYAGIGMLGIVMKFSAGGLLSYAMMKARPLPRSIYMLVLVTMILIEVRLLPISGIEQWGLITWVLALGCGVAIYNICLQNARRFNLTGIDRVMIGAIFAFFVLLNYHGTVLAPVGTFSLVNTIFFKYIFAVGIVAGHIYAQFRIQREVRDQEAKEQRTEPVPVQPAQKTIKPPSAPVR